MSTGMVAGNPKLIKQMQSATCKYIHNRIFINLFNSVVISESPFDPRRSVSAAVP